MTTTTPAAASTPAAEAKSGADDAVIARRDRHMTLNYPRAGIVMAEGRGCELTDTNGKRYLDLFSGFGATILGHCHPELVAAATEQAAKLWHVGNLLDTEPQTLLAERVARHGFGGRSYFCHSGSDANEAAFKLARLFGRRDGGDRYKVIATDRAFHGRGFAAMVATSGDKARRGYHPFLDGFSHVPYNDLPAMEHAIDGQTVAIIVEPIQGEGGMHIPDDGYLAGLRALCDQHDLLLIADEVWTGCGRTGHWFGHQHEEVGPDIMTLGKAVGGGLAVGVMCADQRIAELFSVDSYGGVPHATTLGGNCISAAVATRMFDVVEREDLVGKAAALGERVTAALQAWIGKLPVKQVRGRGLFIGLELDPAYRPTAAQLARTALDRGVLLGAAGDRVLRIAPPLIVSEGELDRGVELIANLLRTGSAANFVIR
jgi:acetylornithine/N-succinyldiaminopimelate aminotransferase